jgi:Ca2+-binding RTX toxin-like protein
VGGPDLVIGDNAKLRGSPHATGLGSDDELSGGLADDDLIGGDADDECFGRKGLDTFSLCETEELSCPRGAADGFRPEMLIGARMERAREILKRFDDGCTIRVTRRDGESVAVTDDFRPNRINVALRSGRIVRILGLG